MKTSLALFVLASTVALCASAQQLNTEVCLQRCNALESSKNPRIAAIDGKLAEIRAQKKVEKDAARLKALDEAEQDQIGRRQDEQEKMCRTICIGGDGA